MTTPIAIISMACRLPGAHTTQEFWPRLLDGLSEPTEIPRNRWNAHQFYDPKPATVGKSATVKGFFLDNVRDFDAGFFKLSEPDAMVMDPQQRILLELAYEALLSSGQAPDSFRNSQTAVYLGITKSDYQDHVQQALVAQELTQKTVVIGVLENLTAARIANYFDLRGPALTIDTACSSALVALHMACESLKLGSIEMALVGGINLNLGPAPYLGMSAAGALSPEEDYYVFDARSRGFFMGEGGGVFLLKPLEQARADGNQVLGVILGSALNNDGKSISAMAPRSATQQAVVEQALKQANITPEEIDFIEAHGTGTPLGDAVEAQSLRSVFKNCVRKPIISTVKPNVGHLLSAAGVPSLVKVLLAFQHRQIPPLANYAQERPELKLQKSGFKINAGIIEAGEKTLTAGINAFGFGGTNAHIILQEAPPDLKAPHFKQQQPKYVKKNHWIELSHEPKKYSAPDTEPALPEAWEAYWQEQPLADDTQREKPTKIWLLSTPFQQESGEYLKSALHSQGVACEHDTEADRLLSALKQTAQTTEQAQELILLKPSSQSQLLKVLQKLAQLEAGICQRLFIITQASTHPESWLRDGLAFAAISELQPIRVHWVQIHEDSNAEQAQYIISELQAPDQDVQALYQKGQRLTRQLKPLVWPPKTYTPSAKGQYLITGGAQGLGAEIARALSQSGAGHLILIGRKPESEAKTWPELHAELSRYGTQSNYYSVDVTQGEEVLQLLTHIQQSGDLKGIVHAAGIASAGRFTQLDTGEFDRVLAPKVKGLTHLINSIQALNLSPDFICLFSSLSSCVPGFARGLAAYATANAYLDTALTAYSDLPLQVINWGPWSETGMATEPALLEQLEHRGILPLKSATGRTAFLRLLNTSKQSLITHTKTPLKPLVYQPPELANRKKPLPPKTEPSEQKMYTKAEEALQKHDPLSQLRQELTVLVEKALENQGIKTSVSLHDNLLDLGLDSLSALELTEQLATLGFEDLPFELLFEQQSIAELSQYLEHNSDLKKKLNPTSENSTEHWPLAPVQQGFYLAHHLSEAPNFSAFRVSLNTALDPGFLSESLKLLFQKHPLLKASFRRNTNTEISVPELASTPWVQSIAAEIPPSKIRLEILNKNEPLAQVEDEFVNRAFDLENDLLLRVGLVQNPDQSVLLIVAHHIIFDAYSMQSLLQDLLLFYVQLQNKLKPQIIEDRRYLDYLQQVSQQQSSEKHQQARNDWSTYLLQFKGLKTGEWLVKKMRQQQNLIAIRSRVHYGKIPEEITQRLLKLSRKENISLQSIYLTAYFQALAQWTGLSDLWVHLAVSGRSWPISGIHQTIGCFAETYPLYVSDPLNFRDLALARKLRHDWNQSKANQIIGTDTLSKLFKEAQIERGFFAFSFAHFDPSWAQKYQNMGISDTQVRGFQSGTGFAFLIAENLNGFCYSLNTPEGLFQDSEIKDFQALFMQRLEQFRKTDPTQEKIAPEPAEILKHKKIDLYSRMLQNMLDNPEQIVCTYQGQDWRASEFLDQSQKIARSLFQAGLKPGDLIGLTGLAGPETSMALLAILQLGCAWLPIDPETPLERLNKILEIARPAAMISGTLSEPNTDPLPAFTGRYTSVSELLASKTDTSGLKEMPKADPAPEQTAYIIFTSGSTGTPQAVPIPYAALQYYLNWCHKTFHYGPWDRVIQTASIAFDASVRQLLIPLLAGACACPVPPEVKQDARALFQFLQTEQITVWSSVPALWKQLLLAAESTPEPDLPALRCVKVGGEVLPVDWVRRWQKIYGNTSKIVNLYGPTECTINATYYLIDQDLAPDLSEIPIGQLLPGYQALIEPIETDATTAEDGELWLSGPGLSPGYLNNAKRNQNSFKIIHQQRYYRSGDRVRQDANGLLYYLGRVDRQVKLNGYRLEPGEIEAVLESIPEIERAVVFVDSEQIQACVVPKDSEYSSHTLKSQIKESTQKQLPQWMQPQQIHFLPELPQLLNGKTDWQQLAALTKQQHALEQKHIDSEALVSDSTATTDSQRKQLAEIWQEVLKRQNPHVAGDFFAQGGNSLTLMELFLKLEKHFTHLPKIAEFYRSREFVWLLKRLKELNPETDSGHNPQTHLAQTEAQIQTRLLPERFALSPTQMGFYVMFHYFKQERAPWIGQFVLQGTLKQNDLEQALQHLTQRHQMLQVQLKVAAPPYFEQVKTPYIFLTYEDICAPADASEIEQESKVQERIKALKESILNPLEYPLLQLHLLRTAPDQHHCLVRSHHILADGLSSQILIKELLQIYTQLSQNRSVNLSPLRSQFSDYIGLLKDSNEAEQQKAQRYWQGVFRPDYQAPKLRKTKKSTNNKPVVLQELRKKMSAEYGAKISTEASRQGVTSFILFWQAYYRALVELSGQQDILIGSAHHGRDYALPDIQNIFGCFARALPLRLKQAESPQKLLERYQETLSHSFDPAALLRLLPPGTRLPQLLGSQFFLTILDQTGFKNTGEDAPLRIDLARSQSIFHPASEDTDLFLAVKISPDQLEFQLLYHPQVLSALEAQSFIKTLLHHLGLSEQEMAKPATEAVTELIFSKQRLHPQRLKAALIGYLPSKKQIQALNLPLNPDQLKKHLFADQQALWLDLLETDLGKTGFLALPYYAEEIAPGRATEIEQSIYQALTIANQAGAEVVSLAGMLPAISGYAQNIKQSQLTLTTGHATTVAAVVSNSLALWQETKINIPDETLAMIGLGSVGQASLEVLLQELKPHQHPHKLILCDLLGSEKRLQELAQKLRQNTAYRGEIRVYTTRTLIPTEVYQARLMIAAVSSAKVIDVMQLKPGTLLVDDSFPHCFDLSKAKERMQQQQDVVIVGGGLLGLHCLQREMYLPMEHPAVKEALSRSFLAHSLPGCQVESLLIANRPDLPHTQGLVQARQAREYLKTIREMGLFTVKPHLEGFILPPKLIQAVANFK